MAVVVSKASLYKDYQKIFRLRYQTYCIENNWLEPSSYELEQEIDRFDTDSIHFIAEEKNEDNILGCMRLIDKNPSIMTEHLFKYFQHEEKLKKENAGELSRLVITNSPHQLIVLKKLFYTTLNYADENGFEYVYLAVSELHMKILTSWKSLSINLVSETPSSRYFNDKKEYLCLIEMKDYQAVPLDEIE
jgi:N-acyl-L-homoserine lactone synthetase